jgi:pseudouridine-5'-phosphate glycosidase
MSEAQEIRVHAEVAEALAEGRPVVALESAIIAHGLPRPESLPTAREFEEAVRAGGASLRTAERAVGAEARRGRCSVGLQTRSFVKRLGEHLEQSAKRF